MSMHDQEFEQRVRTTLESGMPALDGYTRRKLAEGRTRALQHKSFFAHWLPRNSWGPVTALAGCAALAVALFVAQPAPDAPMQLAQSDAEFALELLLGNDDGDTESDPDFYIAMDAVMYEEEQQHAG